MLRHVPEPLHPRRLEPNVRIEPAGDGAVDDGVLLLLQERDQFLLGSDVAPDPSVRVVEEADNGGLILWRGTWERSFEKPLVRQLEARDPNAFRPELKLPIERHRAHKFVDVRRVIRIRRTQPVYAVSGADDAVIAGNAEPSAPSPQA